MLSRGSLAAILASAGTLATAHSALAQPPDCTEPLFQAQINQCAEASYKAADLEMRSVYDQALAQYRDQDRRIAEEDARYANAEMLLRESQEAWTTSSRDFCAARTQSAQGGTMSASVHYGCLAMLTRNRTQDLQWLLD